jgi:NTP pyrophosphatase (non-canonical NTP hydrolase)
MDFVLYDTWTSNQALYDRFGLGITPDQARRMVAEETLEVTTASTVLEETMKWVYDYDNSDVPSLKTELADEIADAIYVHMGLGRAGGLEYRDIEAALKRKNFKNDNKTSETHRVINNKITRK